MNKPLQQNNAIDQDFYDFINQDVLPLTSLERNNFWHDLTALVSDLSPINRQLLATRTRMQNQLDEWHRAHREDFDPQAYQQFLRNIGYLVEDGGDFTISTENVEKEIAHMAGPQ